MISRKFLALSALALAASFGGCNCADKDEENCVAAPAAGNKPGAAAVNTVCPIQPADAADQTVTAEYKGKTIAFCCKGCVTKFNAMDAAGKDAILAKATTYAK